MGKLRKFLAAFFAILSAVFAAVAIDNKLGETNEDDLKREGNPPVWSRDLEAAARAENKLVLFVKCGANLPQFPKAIKNIARTDYILAKISPDEYPADYRVLDGILAAATGRNGTLEAGILSPNMCPIYLTAKIPYKHGHSANFANAVACAAKHFRDNPELLKRAARGTARIVDSPASIPPFGFVSSGARTMLFAEGARLLMFFSSRDSDNAEAAELAENARLAAKISSAEFGSAAALRATEIAEAKLAKKLLIKNGDIAEKLLFARALLEIQPITKNISAGKIVLDFVESLVKSQRTDGLFRNESGRIKTVDNALVLSIFVSAYDLSRNEKFDKCAKESADALERIVKRGRISASIGVKSEASSLEYVLLARAFFDAYKTFGNPQWRKIAFGLCAEWESKFSTPLGVCSINSEDSVLAKFARPILTRDAKMPSYLGEAAQLYAEAGIDRPALRRLVADAALATPINLHKWASLKLAICWGIYNQSDAYKSTKPSWIKVPTT